MKRTTGILVCTLAAGMAWAQNPQIIQNTRTQLNTVQQNNTAASNEALGIKPSASKDSAAKPAATPAKSSAAVVKTGASTPKANVVPAKSSPVAAKPSVAPTKATAISGKPVVAGASAKSKSAVPFAPKKASSAIPAPKLGVKQVAAKKETKPATTQKKKVATAPKTSPAAATSNAASDAAGASQAEEAKGGDDDPVKDAQEKKWSMSGKRDPFISPVVSHAGGSGCSTGKKCLEIGAINLRGVVHSDGGFIAVVTNSMNKAYFLRENDPVFDGYVVKITGDSIVFKETMQDRLGKSFTREVVKKITTPAV
jgi:hypothetical protein